MFKLLVILCTILSASSFNQLGSNTVHKIQMISKEKFFGVALIATSLFTAPVLAVEGAAPKISIFGNSDASSPFAVAESREDAIYSPYSPYGNGDKAVYNGRKGGPEEIAFYKKIFDNCVKRTEKIPTYASKKTWFEIEGELTRYLYNFRGAMLKLASASSTPKEAEKAAKTYFSDINEIFEYSKRKNADKVLSAYEKSVQDLSKFVALVK